MAKLYGSLTNRLEENKNYTKREIRESKEREWVYRYNHWYEIIRKAYDGTILPKPNYKKLEPISFGVKDYYYDWEF